MPVKTQENPFLISGAVTGDAFADRDEERKLIRASLTRKQRFALVYGPRRMGKTSALRVVQEELRGEGMAVAMADLSTASSPADMTHRILGAAFGELGRKTGDSILQLLKRLRFEVSVEVDPVTGFALPKVGASLRDADTVTQRSSLGETLDAIEELARERKTTIGMILDEFQEIHRFGGENAESYLRGIIQHHTRVRYILAGSDERLIQAMVSPKRAFYKMLTPIHFGPIDPEYLAEWIDKRMKDIGIKSNVGTEIVKLAGPRTRDIIQLAHEVVEASQRSGKATLAEVTTAFLRIIESEDTILRVVWSQLSPLQQNILRALSIKSTGLTTAQQRRTFSLGPSGSTIKGVQSLVDRDILVKIENGYLYDSPFMRGWVILKALPDAGVNVPVSRLPE